MGSFAGRTEATKDTWQTPLGLVQALGQFDLDPCADAQAPTRLAKTGFTVSDNGLVCEWFGRVFMNPPYGSSAKRWLKKLADHGNGIALIPPRVGSHWFHDLVFAKCDAIMFLRGRIAFIDPQTQQPVKGNNADSILVAFGPDNVEALRVSGLPGVVVGG